MSDRTAETVTEVRCHDLVAYVETDSPKNSWWLMIGDSTSDEVVLTKVEATALRDWLNKVLPS